MNANPYAQYRDVQVQTASPARLVVMLYDGAIRFANTAKRGIETGDAKLTHEGMTRTQAILDHLTSTLNPDAGDIARNLGRLYEFMGRRLLEASLHRDPRAVDDVTGLLESLRTAYAQIDSAAPRPGAVPLATPAQAVSNLG
ncbi:MAG: flagellar export chaperone FliS [Chloroflexota bacterium]